MVKYAPKNDTTILKSKEVSYCYPSSPRAEYFDAGKTGCYFVTFNHDTAHTGPFETCEEAEAFLDAQYPDVKYGYWSMRSDKAKEQFAFWRQK